MGLSGNIQINSDGISTSINIDAFGTTGTIADLVNEVNTALGGTAEYPKASFDNETARFKIFGVEVPTEILELDDEGGRALETLFGRSSVDLRKVGMSTTITEAGANAQLTVNGIDIERSSNHFTLDGMAIDLLKETDGTEPILL